MSYYIYFQNGVEVSREPKGRGRPKQGAVQQPDGNWHISDMPVPSGVSTVASEPSLTEPKPKPVNNDEEPVKAKTGVFIASRQYGAKQFLSLLHYKDIIIDSKKIIINNPILNVSAVICNGFNAHYSVYSRFEVDRASKTLNIWGMRSDGPPDMTVTNFFNNDEWE